ncbi:hypothetical protein PR048_015415 [Dryococelus australis]|uniref:Vacuolar ATPase assembly protein VMA22 n=1 Tax=Dryococelus australis TaxID=614101 RepID=A0ABQ9HGW2_9NEOP|nr:hypothetical protein PR048_015415 [Dryococelus australis]
MWEEVRNVQLVVGGGQNGCVCMQMDAVCRQLDVLAVEMLELMQEQLRVKAQLTDVMKNGFLNLAKARYISGNTSISALQLPSEDHDLRAQTTVVREGGLLQLVTPESQQMAYGEGEEFEKSTDPLQWFGVLVPRNLRQAQSNFHSALEWAVDGANVQLRLQHCHNRYLLLLKVKQELASSQ